jgi:hypothetical protein
MTPNPYLSLCVRNTGGTGYNTNLGLQRLLAGRQLLPLLHPARDAGRLELERDASGAWRARLPAAARAAGLDEGLLSFSLSILLCMVNPYRYQKCQ